MRHPESVRPAPKCGFRATLYSRLDLHQSAACRVLVCLTDAWAPTQGLTCTKVRLTKSLSVLLTAWAKKGLQNKLMAYELELWTLFVVLLTTIFARTCINRTSYTAERSATFYLTRARGTTKHLTSSQRRVLWKRAVRYISRLLNARKRWARLGKYLQDPRIQSLLEGIERKKGVLKRTSIALQD